MDIDDLVWSVAEHYGADRNCAMCQKVVRHIDKQPREHGYECPTHGARGRPGVVAWLTCEQIASCWKDTTWRRVSSIVSLVGLGKTKAHRRVVDGQAEYSPAAVGLIERELKSRGHKRTEATDD